MRRFFVFLLTLMITSLTVCAENGNRTYAELAHLGDSCMAAYDVTHALTYYRKAMAVCPSAAVRMKITNGYYLQHNYAKCLSMMEGMPLDSLDHDTMCHLFEVCRKLGLKKRAAAFGEAVVRRWPMDGEMVARLAGEYLSAGMDSKAEKLCNNYWMHDETCMAVNDIMADIYMVQRQWQLAKDSYLLLLQQGDSTYKNMLNLGVCYEWLGDGDNAREAFNVAIAMSDSTLAAPLYHQGTVLNGLKDYESSLACFRKALTLLQPDSAVLFTCYRGMAEGYYVENDFRHALPAFLQAQRYDPTSLTTVYFIGICYEALGDKAHAKDAYQHFIQMTAVEEDLGEDLKKMVEDARKRIRAC